jgi:hypothetical protein
MESIENAKIIEVRTTQTIIFKKIIEIMSIANLNCYFVFTSPCVHKLQSLGGIGIFTLSADKCISVRTKLLGKNFELFRCDEPRITIDLDIRKFNEYLKTIDDDEPIRLYVKKDNQNILYLNDMELEINYAAYPELWASQIELQRKITLASSNFFSICDYLNNNDFKFMEIMSDDNRTVFRGYDKNEDISISHKNINYISAVNNKPNQIIKGTYILEHLLKFKNCLDLTNTIEICLKKDYPLILGFCTTLGEIHFIFSHLDTLNEK